jgi:PqqD family protein of HPr-rel-A system
MAAPRYIADPPHLVRKVRLDGLTALFHIPSGMTHILAPPAPQILQVLGKGPATAATILSRISKGYALEKQKDAKAALDARLAELEAAGLVSRL